MLMPAGREGGECCCNVAVSGRGVGRGICCFLGTRIGKDHCCLLGVRGGKGENAAVGEGVVRKHWLSKRCLCSKLD